MSELRGLHELLAEEAGRDLLASRGMHTDVEQFVSALQPPADPSLNRLLALAEDTTLVHIGQQVCADYDPAVASKFDVIRLLKAHDVTTALLWHDADRAGSERYGMRIVIPSGNGVRGLWLAHRSLAEREARFIPVERDQLDDVMTGLSTWLSSRGRQREVAPACERVAALGDEVRAGDIDTLGAVNGTLTKHLLREELGIDVPSTFLSVMLERGLLTASLNAYIAEREGVIRVFNEAIAELVGEGVDPLLRPLQDDYLPLFFSCPTCGVRLRLAYERQREDHYAHGRCRCDSEHRFHLGHGTPSLGELAATGRWSPDVSLPVHHNQIASGWVVGRSTALYGMVFNQVTEQVFGLRPIPGLVPPGLSDDDDADRGQSLLLGYLTAA